MLRPYPEATAPSIARTAGRAAKFCSNAATIVDQAA